MHIVKIYNNNIALVKDDMDREIVVQGRGLAFKMRPGDRLDESIIERRFVPTSSDIPEEFAQLVSEIPSDHIAVAEEILQHGQEFGLELNRHVVVALADHISVAIQRQQEGQVFANPLEWEVRQLYVSEVRLASLALDLIEKRTGVRLASVEATPIALHLVNSEVGAGKLSQAVRTARLIGQILAIIEDNFGSDFRESDPLGCARFATHLRYLFLAHLGDKKNRTLIGSLVNSFRQSEPEIYACAERISTFLSTRMGWEISDDETVYIALHVQRLTATG